MRIFRGGMVFVAGVALSILAVAACQSDERIGGLGERIDSLDQRLTAVDASAA